MRGVVLVDSDEHALGCKLPGNFEGMSCAAERCVHERLVRFECELFEALGEQYRDMPIFVCQGGPPLHQQAGDVDLVEHLVAARFAPDLEETRVAHDDDLTVDGGLLAQIGGQ